MSEAFEGPFPRPPLIAAGVLIVLVVLLAGTARLTGLGTATDAAPVARPVASAELRFTDRPDGSVEVRAGADRAPVATLAPGEDGFVRATLRSLVRERRMHGASHEVPFELALYADGRLTLLDPSTARRLDLAAFGSTNAAAFRRLLTAAQSREGSSP